jgi:hypothetical protein
VDADGDIDTDDRDAVAANDGDTVAGSCP